MANLARLRVGWSGSAVDGPGLTTFYFDEAGGGWSSAVNIFFGAVANRFPAGITWTTPQSGDLIDVATGELSGSWGSGSALTASSTGANGFVRGAGGSIEWATSGIRAGRRVLGRTFLCPLDNGAWSTSGTMNGTAQGALQTAVNTLYSSIGADLRIYSRPGPAGAGQANTVLSGTVPVTVSWLRSRRT